MPCCKCIDFGWPFLQDVLYTDEAGQDYCLFHAPTEHKGMSVEDFNEQVFKRIKDYKLMIETPELGEFCDFSGTIFPGEISFKEYDKDNPLPGISFCRATFSGAVTFRTTCLKETHFNLTEFKDWIDFSLATFGDKADIRNATFIGSAYFERAEFKGVADFTQTQFFRVADFSHATFSEQADFKQTTFDKKSLFARVKAKRNALRLHSLSNASLANLHFTSMDTECFSFKGCDWPEKLWPEAQEKPDFKACEELYRSLKQKAADEHDQPLVSKWHYREKLMGLYRSIGNAEARKLLDGIEGGKLCLCLTVLSVLRLLRLESGLLRSLNFWYWTFSGYGERELRAGAWLAFLAVLPFVLNACQHPIEAFPFSDEVNNALSYFPFAKDLQGQGGWLRLGKGVSQLLIAFQAALFGLALRNRFRR